MAGVDPNSTAYGHSPKSPLIVTSVPPVVGPEVGVMVKFWANAVVPANNANSTARNRWCIEALQIGFMALHHILESGRSQSFRK
jgi:hypothetical protein